MLVGLGRSPVSDACPFCEQRPVVLKIHGSIQDPREKEGFVITEDQYIEYLAYGGLDGRLPVTLLCKVRHNHLLFLGYSLRDWNLRVFLRRLRRSPHDKFKSWSVVLSIDEAEKRFWHNHGVDTIEMTLDKYIGCLTRTLETRAAELALTKDQESSHG